LRAETEFPPERAPGRTLPVPPRNKSEAAEQTFSAPPDPRATMPRGGRCPSETPADAVQLHRIPVAADQQDSQSRYMPLVSQIEFTPLIFSSLVVFGPDPPPIATRRDGRPRPSGRAKLGDQELRADS